MTDLYQDLKLPISIEVDTPEYVFYFLNRFYIYLAIEKHYSLHTQLAYLTDIRIFFEYCIREDIYFATMDSNDLLSFFAFFLYKKKISKKTQQRKISALRTFYKFLNRYEEIDEIETKDFSSQKAEDKLKKHISICDIEFVLNNFYNRNSKLLELRDKALIEFLYSTGARVSEVVNIKIQDFQNDLQTVKVRGKRKKDRLLFLGKESHRRMRNYLEYKKNMNINNEYVFVNSRGGKISIKGIQYIVKQRGKENNMQGITPHRFRHTFATDMLNEGAGIRAVQEFLGHDSIRTTQNYVNISIDNLKKIYWRTHPHAKSN